ncbi:hypothetical protein Aspvir_002911 [Aspergillus viridinutans]|uniref:Uncharacterized protein n=1 Tax=Aspergillus viridinutans TaxID=75553 RepID=A0A9P3C361_ASPVI|nr:uncharacterized protein Aspvir_002911 [Aspergillus viridinutans]GIK07253.1 hypothetical protein Aspvir_002911 [Aspergillus viridinutans]
MAVSIDFIVGLIFNLMSLITSLITMWQTQKMLAMKQCPQYASLNDIEADGPSQVNAPITEKAPVTSRGEKERTEHPPSIASDLTKPPKAIVREKLYDSDSGSVVET